MFNDSSIEYDFNEITDNEEADLIGKVLMFVNSKYYYYLCRVNWNELSYNTN